MHTTVKSLWNKITKKPLIVTVHGYGRRRKHEFDNLALWGTADSYDIVQFDMYDIFDSSDDKSIDWINRAQKIMYELQDSQRPIILIGFSMGGVIASYLATLYPVAKLILLAPAFQYINKENITNFITKSIRNEKTEDEVVIPSTFFKSFLEIIHTYKNYICHVSSPVLIIHGDDDEVISVKSSKWGYDQIPHQNKRLIILHGGHHRLLMDEAVNWECYQIIKLFINSSIILNTKIENAPDILDKYKKSDN